MEQNKQELFNQYLEDFQKQNDLITFQKAIQLIIKLFQNLHQNPNEEKFKSVNKQNQVLKQKLFNINQIDHLFFLVGFELDPKEDKLTIASTITNIQQQIEPFLIILDKKEQQIKDLIEEKQKYIQEKEKQKQESIKNQENFFGHNKYHIIIKFNNGQHQEVSRLTLDEQTISPETYVHDFIDPKFMPHLKQLNWQGFGLWCGHDAVTRKTQFRDIKYQRKQDSNQILFDCEDHNCQYRAILTPIIKQDICKVCGGVNDKKKSLLCMHYVCCSTCYTNIDSCLQCNKRVKQV